MANMARIGEQGMHPGADYSGYVRGENWANKECIRAALSTSYLNTCWWKGRGREGERDREGEREGERERGERDSNCENRISPEGWAQGVLTLTFEMTTSFLNALWWMVDSCMARIGDQGMRPGFFVQ